MRVHAIRGARHQRDPILPVDHAQLRRVIRFDDADVVHLVGQGLAHDLQVDEIALHHLVEPREHGRPDQSAMAGDDGVRARPAHGKAGAVQMPDAHGELVFPRTVVDRQIDVYLRDLDRSHDPVAGIQKTLVFGVLGCLGVGLAGSLAAAVGDVEWIDRLAQDRLTAGRQLGVVFRGGTQLVARLGEGPSVDLFAHLLALRSQFTA